MTAQPPYCKSARKRTKGSWRKKSIQSSLRENRIKYLCFSFNASIFCANVAQAQVEFINFPLCVFSWWKQTNVTMHNGSMCFWFFFLSLSLRVSVWACMCVLLFTDAFGTCSFIEMTWRANFSSFKTTMTTTNPLQTYSTRKFILLNEAARYSTMIFKSPGFK